MDGAALRCCGTMFRWLSRNACTYPYSFFACLILNSTAPALHIRQMPSHYFSFSASLPHGQWLSRHNRSPFPFKNVLANVPIASFQVFFCFVWSVAPVYPTFGSLLHSCSKRMPPHKGVLQILSFLRVFYPRETFVKLTFLHSLPHWLDGNNETNKKKENPKHLPLGHTSTKQINSE